MYHRHPDDERYSSLIFQRWLHDKHWKCSTACCRFYISFNQSFPEHVFDCVLNAPPGFCSWMKILVKCFFVRHEISIDSFFYHRVEERLKHQQRRSQDKIRSAKKSMKSKIVQQHQLHQRPTNRRGENPKKERTKEYSSLFTMPW